MKITVYQNPACTTCKNLDSELRALGAEYEKINYYTDGISAEKLKSLVAKMDMPPKALLRTKAKEYKLLNLDSDEVSDDEIIGYMIRHPDLMQRPIVEMGDKAVLARPAEKIREIIGQA